MLLRNSLCLTGDTAVKDGASESILRLQHIIVNGPRGIFDQNNGTIAFVTGSGEYRVAPYSEVLSEALRTAGYKEQTLFVAFSNGELPAGARLRAEWMHINEQVQAMRQARAEERALTTYLSEAAVAGIAPEVAHQGAFWCVDNVAYRGSSLGPVHKLPGRFDNVEQRAQIVGQYDTNNGLLVFVDESGATFIGQSSRENLAILSAAGYRSGSIFVPFSNGEQPLNGADVARLRAIRTTSSSW
jgi:hypothetical protein